REIQEELNIKIDIDKLFSVNSHVYEKESDKHHVVLITFLAKYVSGDLKNIDCQNSKWVKLNELKDYDFVPADIQIVDQLLNNLNL
ncbi:MAG: NUDIX domain-containing protein, partial [Candidatus Firestonebacteria bacterium]